MITGFGFEGHLESPVETSETQAVDNAKAVVEVVVSGVAASAKVVVVTVASGVAAAMVSVVVEVEVTVVVVKVVVNCSARRRSFPAETGRRFASYLLGQHAAGNVCERGISDDPRLLMKERQNLQLVSKHNWFVRSRK